MSYLKQFKVPEETISAIFSTTLKSQEPTYLHRPKIIKLNYIKIFVQSLTAIITSGFKTAVKRKMWMIVRKFRAAVATGEGCCNLAPNKRSASHPGGLV